MVRRKIQVQKKRVQSKINSVTANFRTYIGLVVDSSQPVIQEKLLLRILIAISLRPELE